MFRDASLVTLLAVIGCHRDEGMLRVSGTVEIRELQLAPLTWGRLTRLLKDEGDSVHRGDTIAVLDQPGLDPLISQRRAQAHAAAQRVNQVPSARSAWCTGRGSARTWATSPSLGCGGATP